MKKSFAYFFLMLAIFNQHLGFSQTGKIDSLYAVYRTANANHLPDSARIDISVELAWELAFSDLDSSIRMVNRALVLSEKTGSQKNVGRCYHSLGWFYDLKSDYSISLEYYNKALLIWEQYSMNVNKAATLGNMGSVYANIGDHPLALDYYFRSQRLYEDLNDEENRAIGLGNIGLVYADRKEFDKALEYYRKALANFQKTGNTNGEQAMYGNIGNLYRDTKQPQRAFEFLEKALALAKTIGNKDGIATNLGNIGLLYHYTNPMKAIDYYSQALAISKELGDKSRVATWEENLGEIEILEGDYAKAEEHLEDALNIFTAINDNNGQMETEEDISFLYENTGRKNLALSHFKRFCQLKDSIFNSEKERAITFREMAYEFDKKQSAVKEVHDKVMAVAETQKKKQRLVIILATFGFFLVAIFSIFIFRSLKITRRQKDVIAEQKNTVEEKQKEILDSIHYAKRIQRALLPSEWYIEKILRKR